MRVRARGRLRGGVEDRCVSRRESDVGPGQGTEAMIVKRVLAKCPLVSRGKLGLPGPLRVARPAQPRRQAVAKSAAEALDLLGPEQVAQPVQPLLQQTRRLLMKFDLLGGARDRAMTAASAVDPAGAKVCWCG